MLLAGCRSGPDQAARAHEGAFAEFQKGVNLYWHVPNNSNEIVPWAERAFNYIEWLGANSVAIAIPFYTDGPTPTRAYVGDESPTQRQLAYLIREAKSRGLHVLVRPLLDEKKSDIMGHGMHWRGTIQPKDMSVWFDSYRGLLRRWATTLQSAGADEFAVGTELPSLEGETDEWAKIIRAVKAQYKGRVSYSFNWQPIRSDMPFAYYGVDAYPSIPLGDDAPISDLTAAMVAWLQAMPRNVLTHLTIHEIGIPGLSGVFGSPWIWNSSAPMNFQNQVKWFEAIYAAAKQMKLGGIYYWMLDSNLDPAKADPATDQPGSFVKRPGEDAIRKVFHQR